MSFQVVKIRRDVVASYETKEDADADYNRLIKEEPDADWFVIESNEEYCQGCGCLLNTDTNEEVFCVRCE